MNQTKRNRRPWYMLGLALLLCTAAVILATGTTLARYRAERNQSVTFRVRPQAQICLGVLTEAAGDTQETTGADDGAEAAALSETAEPELVFEPGGELTWVTETEAERYLLSFAVANGESESSYSKEDQIIRVRLISSAEHSAAGEQEAEETVIYLRIPSETEDGTTDIAAVVTPIEEGTDLFATNGYGNVYTFCEEKTDGEGAADLVELTFTLPGGAFTYIPFTVVLEGSLPYNEILLQPQIIAELTD